MNELSHWYNQGGSCTCAYMIGNWALIDPSANCIERTYHIYLAPARQLKSPNRKVVSGQTSDSRRRFSLDTPFSL
jgi:hypothetical protein